MWFWFFSLIFVFFIGILLRLRQLARKAMPHGLCLELLVLDSLLFEIEAAIFVALWRRTAFYRMPWRFQI